MTLFGESQPFEENMLLLVVAIMHGYVDIQELFEDAAVKGPKP